MWRVFNVRRSRQVSNHPRIQGIVKGRIVELDRDPGLPDGQQVTVTLRPATAPGGGIIRSAGAWADAPDDEWERWLLEVRRG